MKKTLLVASIIILSIIVAAVIYMKNNQPAPDKLLSASLQKMNQEEAYAYNISQEQMVGGNNRQMTKISGEKSGDNIRIFGQLAGSNIEMIKVSNVLYNKDPFSKDWVKFTDVTAIQEVFLVELNPLSVLQLKDIGEVILKGQEVVNNRKCWVISLQASVQNQILERFWSGFDYTMYIDKRYKTVNKAVIKAKNKENSEPMTIELEFSEMGKKFIIQPPEIEHNQ